MDNTQFPSDYLYINDMLSKAILNRQATFPLNCYCRKRRTKRLKKICLPVSPTTQRITGISNTSAHSISPARATDLI